MKPIQIFIAVTALYSVSVQALHAEWKVAPQAFECTGDSEDKSATLTIQTSRNTRVRIVQVPVDPGNMKF